MLPATQPPLLLNELSPPQCLGKVCALGSDIPEDSCRISYI